MTSPLPPDRELREIPATDQAIRAPAATGKAGNMNGPDDARQWHDEASHLVRGHGAGPCHLTGYTLTLGQLRWAHFDTHAALAIARVRPPDGHVHPAPLDPGWSGSPACRPFPPSPAATADYAFGLFTRPPFFPLNHFTSLPQTDTVPDSETELTDWAAAALGRKLAHTEEWGWPAEPAAARYRDELRSLAGIAAARWQAGTGLPAAREQPAARTRQEPAPGLPQARAAAEVPAAAPAAPAAGGRATAGRPATRDRATGTALSWLILARLGRFRRRRDQELREVPATGQAIRLTASREGGS